jgi:hypothetical protein
MAASKEFLDKYLIHTSPGPKKMLQGQELEDVLDKFEHLSSPNLRNTISLCRSGGKRGAYDNIMAMKTYTTIEYVHGKSLSRSRQGQGVHLQDVGRRT